MSLRDQSPAWRPQLHREAMEALNAAERFCGDVVASGLRASLFARMRIFPIEHAARAFALTASGVDEWDTLDPDTQERLREAVRAALTSIRAEWIRDPHWGKTVEKSS